MLIIVTMLNSSRWISELIVTTLITLLGMILIPMPGTLLVGCVGLSVAIVIVFPTFAKAINEAVIEVENDRINFCR
jgi:hypothetical protein